MEVQSNNKDIMDNLKGNYTQLRNDRGLLMQIRNIITDNKVVGFSHIFREANLCADIMAKLSLFHDLVTIVYDNCPKELLSLINSDFFGASFPL